MARPDFDPNGPMRLQPMPDPAAEEARRQTTEQAEQLSTAALVDAGATVLGAAVELTESAGAAAEVGGEVVAGAAEAVGGCAQGCSLVIAVAVLLATAGSALACVLR